MPQPEIAQKGPYKVDLEPGKKYWWCQCGKSKRQPFCDGSHKDTDFSPVGFEVQEPATKFLCGCKRTQTPPFCDGSHKKLP